MKNLNPKTTTVAALCVLALALGGSVWATAAWAEDEYEREEEREREHEEEREVSSRERVMDRLERLLEENERFVRSAYGAFEQIVLCVSAAQDDGWQPDRDTRLLAASVWAAVHGLATRWAQGAIPVEHATLEGLLSTTLDLCIGGESA